MNQEVLQSPDEQIVKRCIKQGDKADFQKVMEIIWPLSIQEALVLMRNRKIFTSKIQEDLTETFGYITNTIKEDEQRMQQSVGEIFNRVKTEVPREKVNLIKLARLLYSAKLFDVVHNKK